MINDEIDLIKAHYGDFAGLYDPSQAVAHVKVLLAELATMTAVARSNKRATKIAFEEIERLNAELDAARLVVAAAKVWRTARHGQISGDVFHRACVALSEAVAALNGDLDRAPVAPPSEEDLERGRELVRLAKAYSASRGGAAVVEQLRGDVPAVTADGADRV